MKVTVYELLGLVKDGKELPKKIKVLDVIYELDDHYGDYYNKSLDRFLFVYMTSEEEWKLAYFLNTKVEILEEEKEIPEPEKDILHIDDLITPVDENMYKIWKQVIKNHNKINEIIDYFKSKGDE